MTTFASAMTRNTTEPKPQSWRSSFPMSQSARPLLPVRRFVSPAAVLFLAIALAGCTTVRHSFPQRSSDQVWSALVTAAESPTYASEGAPGDPAYPLNPKPDADYPWTVKENQVWIDEPAKRLEVYRELRQVRNPTSVDPDVNVASYRFRITMKDDDPQSPSASFVSRGFGSPTKALDEADRYFTDVWSAIGGELLPTGGADSPEQAVRMLLIAMFRNDADAIQSLIVPNAQAAVLWDNAPLRELPEGARRRLNSIAIRPAKVGTIVRMLGERREVTDAMMTDDRKIMLANVAGEELAPFAVVRVGTKWKVDPEMIIYRRQHQTEMPADLLEDIPNP